ncbi:MAG TPA: BtrH N-terminal domain-containing protein [Anaerolineales bacterium]|nr:BtrH N-terminal domain-containing protein [Anaerolineales bacterium]
MKTKAQFNGRHWETGSIHNALALQAVKAPHTGKPFSEALLLGVSGGIAFGYFTFEYKGFLPHVAILTRNTFNPFPTILERLGIAQDVQQTTKPEIAEKNLRDTLESGMHPILWADQFSLPYNSLPADEPMWGMLPVLAVETDGRSVTVADRSSQPLHLSMEELTRARGRVKEDRYRLVTLDVPQPTKLAGAVHKGICQAISLFTEEPPRGARDNFGFAAYEKLAEMLVNTRNKHSWERFFAPGIRMYHALAGSPVQPGAYDWVNTWVSSDGADRGLYADFLIEAAQILNKPSLKEAAAKFRESHKLWLKFADALLPDDVPLLGESKKLIQKKHELFIKDGESALPEIKQIHTRLNELLAQSEKDFPLSREQAADLRANLRDILLKICGIERQAVDLLQSAIV